MLFLLVKFYYSYFLIQTRSSKPVWLCLFTDTNRSRLLGVSFDVGLDVSH